MKLHELHCYTTFVGCHARAMNPATTATSPILQTAASTVSPESQGPKGPRAGGSLESFVSKSQILQHLGEELLVVLWPHVVQNPRTRWHQLRVDGLAVPAWTETQSGVSYDWVTFESLCISLGDSLVASCCILLDVWCLSCFLQIAPRFNDRSIDSTIRTSATKIPNGSENICIHLHSLACKQTTHIP